MCEVTNSEAQADNRAMTELAVSQFCHYLLTHNLQNKYTKMY